MNIIAHNMLAVNANRQFEITTKNRTKSTEKLSSGYRINRASDNAAELCISEKMRSQIRGLTQGIENSEDGIALCQVADGALAEISEMLHRITELSVQSANDTYTAEDRKAIQQEINQVLQEIDKIGDDTEFNTQKIFQPKANNYTVEKSDNSQKSTATPTNIRHGIEASFRGQGIPSNKSIKEYKIYADEKTGITINGTDINLVQIVDASGNTFSSNPITAGTYEFTYNGISFSFDIAQRCSKDTALKAINSLCFPYEVKTQITHPLIVQGTLFDSIRNCSDSFFDIIDHQFHATETGIGLDSNTEVSWTSIGIDINNLASYTGNTYTFMDPSTNYSFSFLIGDEATKADFLDALNNTKLHYDIMMPHTTSYYRGDYKIGKTTLLGYNNVHYTKSLYQTMGYQLASPLPFELHFTGNTIDTLAIKMTAKNGNEQEFKPTSNYNGIII